MRLFYGSYANNEKLAPMVREIGWTHNIVILEKCKDELEREFYLQMTRRRV
jgi:predicted nuclease of restriction endonuclease-like (RecB) superfamily